MELDGYSEPLGVAFEYQGKQHFSEVSIFRGDLSKRIRDDETKASLCQLNGVRLLILTYEHSSENFAEIIQKQAIELGIPLDKLDLSHEIDFDKAFIRTDRLDEMKQLLEPKKITVLSPKWISTDYKYKLLCGVCGHTWMAKGSTFFNERRTSGCDKCARSAAVERRRGTLTILEEFAKKHGGEVISTEFVKTTTHYHFRCQFGHDFERNYQSMKDNDSFCLTCEGHDVKQHRKSHVRLTHDDAANIVRGYALEPLEPYQSTTKRWMCKCLNCEEVVTIALGRLEHGAHPCLYCAGLKIRARDALKLFLEKDVTPISIDSFPGSDKGWNSTCNKCHQLVSPSYSSLRSGQGGCKYCRYDRL